MKKSILKTALIAGSLDITAACLHAWFAADITPMTVLQYIASGAFGDAAYKESFLMPLCGLLFHYFIAFCCTACFFWLYPRCAFLRIHWFLSSIFIGTVAWIITNMVIVPLSLIPYRPFHFLNVIIAWLILIFCIGIPIAYSASKYFNRSNTPEIL